MAAGWTSLEESSFSSQRIEAGVHQSITCLCGRIQGLIRGHRPLHQICHCADCKKITGGTHGDLLVTREQFLEINSGTTQVLSFQATQSTSEFKKYLFRCEHCSSPIYLKERDMQTDRIFIFAGCLVNHQWLQKPDIEIFMQEKCRWLPKLRMTPAPSPEPDVELVQAEPDMEIVRSYSASEESDE
ncbi:Mss4-like protein [Annulohypoxylon maeteangense]|uniref:Mss4-like protein n=1 Tax=Annulohypoxylon maeteangense TaxID=1927788 RepID=UPI002007BB71|nr:Mss4-like protein [Annulohypoxylon maeteangense]KAI0884793.1 Mss4-like protein [Annulohypoxylon maeteangense]